MFAPVFKEKNQVKAPQQTQETPSEGTETTGPLTYHTRQVAGPPASAEAMKSSAAAMPTPVWKLVKELW